MGVPDINQYQKAMIKHCFAEANLAAIRLKREIFLAGKDPVNLMHACSAMQHEMEILIDLCMASSLIEEKKDQNL